MSASKLFRVGILGTTVAALCCATPILALAFGALGLSAWPASADYVMILALVLFVGLTVYATYRMRQGCRPCQAGSSEGALRNG